ncbi:mandelate racemase/muconate lactonizing enzyme family protein [Winogradskyella sp.]|uniref:mandelate racemase/muconate lactonizing enzyme family protein n=1 Tax=Winogradskyella sp. TaxID=1883156 RepID=UPI002629F14B|nr:mandelate racemase/muconate lactonizing enzyme family protein [Winogradskyella sp.]
MKRKDFLRTTALGTLVTPFFGYAAAQTSGFTNETFMLEEVPNSVKEVVKITSVKVYRVPRAIFIKVETDAGVSGWGEAGHDNPAVVSEVFRSLIKPMALNKDPFQSEALWHDMLYSGEDLGLSGVLTAALAGFDNALWDLKGKLLNMPVYKLLGGAGMEKMKVYGSFGVDNGRKSTKKAQAAAQEFLDNGYDTFKLRMQIRIKNRNPENDLTEKYVKAVREVIGDNNTLFVDFNYGYTAGKAVEMIKRLYEKYNVSLVEEPVHYHDYKALAEVVQQSPIRIAAGEHQFNRWDFKNLILQGNVGVLNLDATKGGGISEMKKAAVLCQAFEREVMVHNARPTLATAASLHLVASIFNPARVQEYGGPRLNMGLQKFFKNYFKVEQNYIYIPQEPGLGLILDEKALAEFLDD